MPLYASFPWGAPPDTTATTWDSGSLWATSAVTLGLPSSPALEVGDLIVVFGISRHDVAANKGLSTPAGYTAGTLGSFGDYLCNILPAWKTATLSDIGASVSFGSNCRRIDWFIVKNAGAVTSGTGSAAFNSGREVPSVTGAASGGLHLVSATVSGDAGTTTVWPAQYDNNGLTSSVGYSAGMPFVRENAPSPTGAGYLFNGTVASGSTSVSVHSVYVGLP